MERLRKTLFWIVFCFMIFGGVGTLSTIWDAYYDPTFPIGAMEGPFSCDYRTIDSYVRSSLEGGLTYLAFAALAWPFRRRWLAIIIMLAPFVLGYAGLLGGTDCPP